ncbi:MAG: GntR family transcriptional regulator [Actinobacteria bacterium]|nr:GntR family transcriptional regulator [Actinomycetota bacterium]
MSGTVALIRDRLRDAILSGKLPPGQPATQADLAERFGVSRTPLREALRMLELEGLVVRGSNGRFRISPLSIGQIEDLAVMRINLEAVAVTLTVPQFGHAEHAKLEGLLAQIERYALVEDWVGIETPHRDFHQMLVSGAGDRVTALLAQLWTHATRYRTVAFQQLEGNAAGWGTSQLEHRAIVAAYEAYDAEMAAGWIAAHIARAAILVAAHIDPDHPVTRVHESLQRYTGTPDLPEVPSVDE